MKIVDENQDPISRALTVVNLVLLMSAGIGAGAGLLIHWLGGSPDAAGITGLCAGVLSFVAASVVHANRQEARRR